MSLSVTTSLAVSLPATVVEVLFLVNSFGTIPFGITDCLTQHPVDPKDPTCFSNVYNQSYLSYKS